MKSRRSHFLICLIFVASCAHRSPEERRVDLPPVYLEAEEEGAMPALWWTAFGDAQLDEIVSKALQGNLTLEQAEARLRQAEAIAIQVGASRFPTLDAEGDAGSSRQKVEGVKSSSKQYGIGLAASYEVDLWGRVSASTNSSGQDVVASAYDVQTATMTLAAETTTAYFTWQYYYASLELLKAQLVSRKKILDVMENRFRTAQADASDVLQQRERVAAAEAEIPPVEAALQSAAFSLSVLLGMPPQQDPGLTPQPFPGLPVRPATGLPADLLSRRPDLQAAWALLAAADWDIKAAEANRLPTLRLTGAAVYEGGSIDQVFENWLTNLAAGLTAPLIDGGKLKAEVARTRALADERFSAYRALVLDALTEVENALLNERQQLKYLDAVERQLAASTRSTDVAYNRYVRGQDSFFEALVQETARQALESTVLRAHFELLGDRIQLYRSLGGDWEEILQTVREENNE